MKAVGEKYSLTAKDAKAAKRSIIRTKPLEPVTE